MSPKRKSRVKATLHRLEDGLRQLFLDKSPGPSTAQYKSLHLSFTDWDGLQRFTGILNTNSSAFGPFAIAIGRFSRCVEQFENQARAHEGYKKISTDLNDLFHTLAGHFERMDPASITSDTFKILARSVDNEIEPLELDDNEEPRGDGGATQDLGGVLRCYRRVRTLLALFAMNELAKIWQVDNEEHMASNQLCPYRPAKRDSTLQNIRLECLLHPPNMRYRAVGSDDVHQAGCTPNTRTDVLQDLRDWVHYGKFQKVYWLNGIAGTGKTTVAHSLCEWLESSGKPSASFFCSRHLPDCRDVKRILPSVAYQLAELSRPFRCAVSRALDQDPKLGNRPVDEQFKRLIAVPFENIGHTFGIDVVVVLDALDECEDKDGVKQVLDACFNDSFDFPVRFLITSRRNPGILERMLASQPGPSRAELRLHEVDRTVALEDVRTYLGARLEHLNLSDSDIECLIRRSGGWFQYAVSIVKYIGRDNVPSVARRLKRLLAISSYTETTPIQEMDLFFTTILDELIDQTGPDDSRWDGVLLVLRSMLCIREPLSICTIAELLRLDFDHLVHLFLRPLLPVLHVSNSGELGITLYDSFANYLLDPQRSSKFHCDVQLDNMLLAQSCFTIFDAASPAFNLCNLESSYFLDQEVTGIGEQANESIPHAMWYASRHWATHLKLARVSDDLLASLQNFLSKRLLLWMEVMNLKHSISRAVELVRGVHTWLKDGECPTTIQDLVFDTAEFIAAFSSSVVSESTPHIYISALPFWPAHRPVSAHYLPMLRCAVKARGARLDRRDFGRATGPSRLGTKELVDQTLEGHTNQINSVVYSPDGAYIASGSSDKTVRIWDARTGQPVDQPLQGHTSTVFSVAYSPDGAYIASGSCDTTVRIWDAQTCQPVGQPLKGHTGTVWSVVYSPDGAFIACGSSDSTLRIWDVQTCKPVGQPLKGHTNWVNSVAYSPDGAYIASGSDDTTIRIWDSGAGHGAPSPSIGPVTHSHDRSLLPSTFARYITRSSRTSALVVNASLMLT
ncbi:hypothetical protein FS749_015500, partial [Ceratobasidium sp. UAMH 11750]